MDSELKRAQRELRQKCMLIKCMEEEIMNLKREFNNLERAFKQCCNQNTDLDVMSLREDKQVLEQKLKKKSEECECLKTQLQEGNNDEIACLQQQIAAQNQVYEEMKKENCKLQTEIEQIRNKMKELQDKHCTEMLEKSRTIEMQKEQNKLLNQCLSKSESVIDSLKDIVQETTSDQKQMQETTMSTLEATRRICKCLLDIEEANNDSPESGMCSCGSEGTDTDGTTGADSEYDETEITQGDTTGDVTEGEQTLTDETALEQTMADETALEQTMTDESALEQTTDDETGVVVTEVSVNVKIEETDETVVESAGEPTTKQSVAGTKSQDKTSILVTQDDGTQDETVGDTAQEQAAEETKQGEVVEGVSQEIGKAMSQTEKRSVPAIKEKESCVSQNKCCSCSSDKLKMEGNLDSGDKVSKVKMGESQASVKTNEEEIDKITLNASASKASRAGTESKLSAKASKESKSVQSAKESSKESLASSKTNSCSSFKKSSRGSVSSNEPTPPTVIQVECVQKLKQPSKVPDANALKTKCSATSKSSLIKESKSQGPQVECSQGLKQPSKVSFSNVLQTDCDELLKTKASSKSKSIQCSDVQQKPSVTSECEKSKSELFTPQATSSKVPVADKCICTDELQQQMPVVKSQSKNLCDTCEKSKK